MLSDQRGLDWCSVNQEIVKLKQLQPRVSCSGWKYHCICPEHVNVTGGILSQYRRLLEAGDSNNAAVVRKEIRHLQKTLGRN